MRSWRAGSLTLGLVLIGFGVSMLLSKIIGTFTLLDVVVWWPVVLILLGLEILASLHFSSDTPPKVKFDGGSIILTALLLAFAMGFSAVSFAAGLVPGGAETLKSAILNEKAVFDREYVLTSKNLAVNNMAGGKISMSSYDGNQIRVKAVVTIDNMLPEKAKSYADSIISTDSEMGSISTSISDLSKEFNNVKVNFEIKVPRGASAEIINTNGDVEIFDAECNVILDSGYGRVSLNRVNGSIDIRSAYGAIELFKVNGSAKVRSKYGNVHVADFSGGLDINSDSGDVEVLAGNEISGNVSICATNGSVKVAMVQEQGGSLKASAYSGNISTNLSGTVKKEGGAQKLETGLAKDGPVFDISTNSGSLQFFVGDETSNVSYTY